MFMRRRYIGIIIGTLLLAIGILVASSFYMIDYALKPDGLSRSCNIESSFKYMFETYPELQPWVDSLQQAGGIIDQYITNDNNLSLHAIAIPAAIPTRKVAVLIHGYTDNSIRMLHLAYLYNRILGYHVLLPDLAAHGYSQGDVIQMGWKDRLDVLLWTEYADELFTRVNRFAQENTSSPILSSGVEMVVHGISMGAATTMMLAGEIERGQTQQPFIKCLIEDCGYTTVWDEFCNELSNQFGLPAFPLMHLTNLLCKQKYGWSFQEASALEAIKHSTLPMLFIHGAEDDFVPTNMVYSLYDAKPQPKELWVVPGVDHAHSYRDQKQEYTARVKTFVDQYIH